MWLGAPAPGGLALPPALPSAAWLYAPRGVWLGDDLLVVADTGNHRVLIWHGVPTSDGAPADVVLGQPDAASEGPAAGGRGPRGGMRLPTGVLVTDGRLVVADAWFHRVLVWDEVPTVTDTPPDLVLGQPDPESVLPNAGGPPGPGTFYWPFGLGMVAGRFYVADTGNRRVLGWSAGLPSSPGVRPDLVLGQPDPASREENRGGPVGPASFRWPHDITGDAATLLVADAGNHRVLGWAGHPAADRAADLVLGQPDRTTASEFPYAPGRPDLLRFPYAVDHDAAAAGAAGGAGGAGTLAVADTANNRVLLWDGLPRRDGAPAVAVLGQPSFAATGENRWQRVEPDTFCWPYGLSLRGDRLAVADSGNNRVMIWRRRP
ncbi:MAG: NHL repeat-containing protein [Frankia sp.]|nr:NHL repeat-containing protein [Frankia sp.]